MPNEPQALNDVSRTREGCARACQRPATPFFHARFSFPFKGTPGSEAFASRRPCAFFQGHVRDKLQPHIIGDEGWDVPERSGEGFLIVSQ